MAPSPTSGSSSAVYPQDSMATRTTHSEPPSSSSKTEYDGQKPCANNDHKRLPLENPLEGTPEKATYANDAGGDPSTTTSATSSKRQRVPAPPIVLGPVPLAQAPTSATAAAIGYATGTAVPAPFGFPYIARPAGFFPSQPNNPECMPPVAMMTMMVGGGGMMSPYQVNNSNTMAMPFPQQQQQQQSFVPFPQQHSTPLSSSENAPSGVDENAGSEGNAASNTDMREFGENAVSPGDVNAGETSTNENKPAIDNRTISMQNTGSSVVVQGGQQPSHPMMMGFGPYGPVYFPPPNFNMAQQQQHQMMMMMQQQYHQQQQAGMMFQPNNQQQQQQPTMRYDNNRNNVIVNSSGDSILRGNGGVVKSLAMNCDVEQLSDYQILVRQQLELFEADVSDVECNTQGRKKPVVVAQVGLRCRHCAQTPFRHRGRGAVYYPAKLEGVYQAAQNMAGSHLCKPGVCPHLPIHIQQQLNDLRARRDNASGGKQYWADGCRALGLMETADHGLRFVSSTMSPTSASVAAADSDASFQQMQKIPTGRNNMDNTVVKEPPSTTTNTEI